MSQLYDGTVTPTAVDTRPCAGARADLKNCLLSSDCVVKVSHSLINCWTQRLFNSYC